MADIIIAKRLIDFVGLNVKGPPESYQRLFKDVALVLALNEALGPDGAQLLNVDGNGNLRTTLAGSSAAGAVIINDSSSGNQARVLNQVDASGGGLSLLTYAFEYLFNGATFDRARSMAAGNMSSFGLPGVALVSPPGNWDVSSNPAAGTAASASRAGGGAGVRHICKSITIILSATTALGAITTVTINLRDGASGAGTILESFQMTLPAAAILPQIINIPDVNVAGTANTAMTVEGSAAVGNLMESISFRGTDAA